MKSIDKKWIFDTPARKGEAYMPSFVVFHPQGIGNNVVSYAITQSEQSTTIRSPKVPPIGSKLSNFEPVI